MESTNIEGYLWKWTNYLSRWKKRYFILIGDILCYYINKGEKPRGKFHLSVASVNALDDPFKFEIDSGLNIIYLRADTKEEKLDWIKTLRKAIINIKKRNLEKNRNYLDRFINSPKEINRLVDNIEIEPKNSIMNKLIEIRQAQNDLKTYSNQIRYLIEDSNLNKDEIINKIDNIIGSNNNKLQTLENGIEEIILHMNIFSKEFFKFANLFKMDENKFNIKTDEQFDHILNTDLPSDRNELIKLSKSSNKCYNSEIVKKDSEVFYAASEINNEKHNNFEETDQIYIDINRNNLVNYPEIKQSDNYILRINNSHSKFYDSNYVYKRTFLPAKRKKINFSVWSILKDAIGKDLNKFAIPVYLNEPLSMLQRLCENFQYADLLNKASCEVSPYLRLAYVGAFCMGGFSFNPKRTLKFFNPLLGETYEYIDNHFKFRYFSEQVSHHPAISACYVEGENYTFYSNSNVKSEFKLMHNTLEFIAMSKSYVTFQKFGETICFSKPIATVRNLIGNVYIDCYGKFTITNLTTGDYADFEIFEADKIIQGKVKGEIKNLNGEVKMVVEGNWLSHLDVFDIKNNTVMNIWKKASITGDEEEKFFFTDYVINLNNISSELAKVLPPTDSRFRPDQRALENQDIDFAAKEKRRLEDKQRAKRSQMEKEKKVWKPMYFQETYDDLTGELNYIYSGDYWKDRKEHNFEHFPDIF